MRLGISRLVWSWKPSTSYGNETRWHKLTLLSTEEPIASSTDHQRYSTIVRNQTIPHQGDNFRKMLSPMKRMMAQFLL